jgi:hypothetical protein
MSPSTPSELKKLLLAEGFEIYRTLSDQIILADRVRDNLIMDSGVAARIGDVPSVRFTVRAQGSDFPMDSPEQILDRARQMASQAAGRGYWEVSASSVEVRDPGDNSQILDVWHEVAFERSLTSDAELIAELRYALSIEKTAPR